MMNNTDGPDRAHLARRLTLLLFPPLLLVLVGCGGPAPAGNSALAPADDTGMGNAGEVEEEMEEMSGDTLDKMGDDMASSGAMEGDEMMGEEEMAAEKTADDDMAGDEMATEAAAGDDMAGDMDEGMGERPAWQLLPLSNARTGETFTLADFEGLRVFVEPMATWCSNCRQQLENVRAAKRMAPDDAVFVALSVETSLTAGQLASYADAAGFDWLFAVMTPEMLTALVEELGRPVSNPPATPHFVIGSDGSWTELVTGIASPEAIVALIEAAP
jgi:hypothetical protein